MICRAGRPSAPAGGWPGLATAWSINAHNFMDGIDGLLGMQMLFYFTALGAWHGRCRLPGWHWRVRLAAAMPRLPVLQPTAGTHFHGRCRQRGAGLAGGGPGCAAVAAAAAERVVGLILSSAFIVDASLTLMRRMRRGRRWYTAHREHAYQWLVRSGLSHARVTFLLAWNLLVALPLALAALAWPRLAPGRWRWSACWAAGACSHSHHCRTTRDRRRRGAA